jgi:ethanolamine permease
MATKLKKSLSPLLLWSLGVGYVISGMYFGWNLGLEKGGTYGMAIATLLVIIMYICFSFSYCELACAIPKAGGGFDYAIRAYGKKMGFITGLAQFCLVIFTMPAIAIGIGANLNLAFPNIPITIASVIVFVFFTLINIIGVKLAATIEMVITILAIIGLLVFAGVSLPHFSMANFSTNPSIGGFGGIFASIPFAIWFFLGIECLANNAEESENPQRDLSKGFASSLITLIILTVITFIASIGLGGWQKVVYDSTNNVSDSPLPLALGLFFGKNSLMYQSLIWVGILGLIASFHGGLLAGGRVTLELGRVGFAPKFLGNVHEKYKTPANALIFNMLVGIIILFTGKTGEIITLAVFGVLVLYIVSMASLMQLRRTEPHLPRPFKVKLYPIMPILALLICAICFVAMAFQNQFLVLIFGGFILVGFLAFQMFKKA